MLQLRRWTIGWFVASLLAISPVVAVEQENICRYCGQDHLQQYAAAVEQGGEGLKYAPDRVVDVKHIKIDVVPNFEQRTVAGTTTLTFAPISKSVEQVTLDAERLNVSNIESSVPLADYVLTDHKLTLLFATPVRVGQDIQVAITYTAQPQKGLYFRTPELGYPAEDTHLWTQGETHEAPHWFPCFDYPNERSTTEVICTVPEEMVVVSNGRQLSEEVKEGLKTVHWYQDKPHASYLVCLVAGKFQVLEDKHRDIALRFFTQPSLAEHGANSFQDTRTIMEFYEAEIGIPFPWDKYDQATILDFNSGGMENTTITTLTSTTIFSKETENIHSSRNLDAHEMAHQWFGDYVTCEDWANLWLNEGFATYYTHLYNEHKLGRDELLYGLWRDATSRVLPQTDNPKPIVYRGYDSPWEQFDFRAYPKGSWVLHMLRSQLGEDLYRAGIKHYLEQNGQKSVVTADLKAALEEVSGRELDRFFDQWVFLAGSPKLKVRYKWLPKERLAQITVEQTQKRDDNTGLFELPTTVRFTVDGKPVDHDILINKEKHEFYVPLENQPTLVRFDPEYTVLAEVDFDKPQAMVFTQLEAEGDMLGRLFAARQLGKNDSHQSVEALQKTLTNDPYYGVRIQAAESLERIGSDEAFLALAESLHQSDARVREAVVEQVGKFYRPEALVLLKQVVDKEANPAIVATAVRSLGKYASDDVQASLITALDRPSFENEIAMAAIHALGETNDESLRGKVLAILQRDRHEFGDRSYGRALSVMAKLWKNADDKQPARAMLETALHDPSRKVRSGAIEALGELGDPRAVGALRSFADREGLGRDATAASSAIEKLQKDAPFVPREVSELRKQIGDLTKQQADLKKEIETLKGKLEATREPHSEDVSTDTGV